MLFCKQKPPGEEDPGGKKEKMDLVWRTGALSPAAMRGSRRMIYYSLDAASAEAF